VFFAGVGWEVFEYALGVVFTGENYLADTATDLLADMGGSFLAFLWLRRYYPEERVAARLP
jgi:hypothetical protein